MARLQGENAVGATELRSVALPYLPGYSVLFRREVINTCWSNE
ncbi:hypothetical protein MGWOODY_XGa1879 [hydrothermal vent metagenome]|uniref:Uncharacterized protein n=1 Tax=hydrothermal vent metagenome TaxID=652676 RepID=A0A160TYF7_9ZZZZ